MRLEKITRVSEEQQLTKQLQSIEAEIEKVSQLIGKVNIDEGIRLSGRMNQLTIKRSSLENRVKRLTNQDYRRRQDDKCEYPTMIYDGVFNKNTFMSHGNKK